MAEASYPPALLDLARLHGIQAAYRDVFGRRQVASGPALLASVQALGARVAGPADIRDALVERRRFLTGRLTPPVAVAWGRRATRFDLRVPPEETSGEVRCRLTLEDGNVREWTTPLAGCADAGTEEAPGIRRAVKRLVVPGGMPFGYHRLQVALGDATGETLLIGAPSAAPGTARTLAVGTRREEGDHDKPPRDWGPFLPMYALRSERSWGIGDLSDLRALLEWVRSMGGGLAAALPFFAAFYDEPFDPSPYAPVSRLFWNEIYVDVTQVPELQVCAEARQLVASPEVASELAELRASPTVEYVRVMALKRRVLELLSRCVGGTRQRAFDAFVASEPLLDDYARFRAACERLGRPWTDWPGAQRAGALSAADIDEDGYRYHRYAQWIAHEQLEALADKKGGGGPLYLDLPIGVSPEGFDVWRERGCFVAGASAGAPPDAMFTKGQDWGFLPMHPDGIRETGYRYPAQCFRRMLRYAGVMRIDHVMGLHRVFMIPPGLDATQGAFIRYPADELYAVLVLEAHRAGSLVLGEDLGTVPGYVRTLMERCNIQRSYVVEYVLAGEGKLHPAGRHDVASLNTHDMATFAAFWSGADIDDRVELGLTDEEVAAREREQRIEIRQDLVALLRGEGLLGFEESPGPAEVLRACLAYLARSEAPLVVVNLEDLWLEEEPQNVPGTMQERPNWRRKARLLLEDMRASSDVLALLEDVNRRRKQRAE